MKKLNTFVHVVEINKDGSHGRAGMFGPTDGLPEWAVTAISNPDVWDEAPESPMEESVSTPDPIKEPPRGGPGSSAEAWREFAKAQNLAVSDDASARDVQAAWDTRG